jgi:anti-sigma factor RsiW
MPDVPDIDCLTAVRQLWDFLDDELTDERMAMVRQHLAQCRRCLPHHDFAKLFLQAVRATREEHLMPAEAGYTG